MTAPTPPPGHALPSGGSIGDGRGLTAAGAALLVAVLGLAGGAVDLATGSGLRTAFAVAFVAGCLLAALTVHREDLVAVVVMPPLVYLVLIVVAAAVEGGGGGGSFLSRQAVGLANALVTGAPALLAATGLALLVAVARHLGGRG